MSNQLPPEISNDLHALDTVRRRVLAIGFLSIILHGIAALIWLGMGYRGEDRGSDAVLMFVIAGVFTALAYLGTRLILAKPLWSPLWIAIFFAPLAIAILWR